MQKKMVCCFFSQKRSCIFDEKKEEMGNLKQLKILESGVEHWNAWREENTYATIDLSHIDFTGAELAGVNFKDADLRESDFSGADLQGADLTFADLRFTTLEKTNLKGADLTGTKKSSPGEAPPATRDVNVLRETQGAYYPNPLAQSGISTFGARPGSSAYTTQKPKNTPLQLLFDMDTLSEEDIAGSIAFLNELYVAVGGDQLQINSSPTFQNSHVIH
jgi:hypothetical protein